MSKAPKHITIGHASTASNGTEAAGDQGQKKTPDYTGEVQLRKKTVTEFNSAYKNWHLIRAKDDDIAKEMARLMILGCNNKHIGYGIGGSGLTSRGGKNKLNTKTNCNTDCSGMVSQVVTEATGKKFISGSATFVSTANSFKVGKSKVFYTAGRFKSYDKTPVYNGDILCITASEKGTTYGHVAMVVEGVPRDGQTDLNPSIGGGVDVSYNGHVTPEGDWTSGWGLTIFAAKGDSGQPNGRGVANPSVKFRATSPKDDKGFISVAAGKEWAFNTRLEIKELPGVVFQVDDRGRSSAFDGQKHLDVFVEDNKVEEYVTTSDNRRVGIMKFAGKHQWRYNQDLHVRVVSSNSTGGKGYGQGGTDDDDSSGGGYLDVDIQYNFVPRTQKLKETDEGYDYYKKPYANNWGKSFNGSYAYGRFCEVSHDKECNLAKGFPKLWYSKKEDKYQRGVAPSLGAIMCFVNVADAGDNGFVCVVEVVHSQYIYVSYTDSDNKFYYKKMTQKDGSWNVDIDGDGIKEYIFQGFIYNPYVTDSTLKTSKLQDFLKIVAENTGNKTKLVTQYTGIPTNKEGWSAAFVNAMSLATEGLTNVIIPDTSSCSSIGYMGIEYNYGMWYDGPAQGGIVCPQLGDILLLRTGKGTRLDRYSADSCGIVTGVSTYDNNTYAKILSKGNRKYKCTISRGGYKDGIARSEVIATNDKLISGLFRPFWNRVDGVSEVTKWITAPIGMYNEGTTIEDAAVRDIAYAAYEKKKYQPSIKKTGITLSAINYTGMLSNMYSVLIGLRASNDDDENLVPDIWSYTPLSQFEVDLFATEPHPTGDSPIKAGRVNLDLRMGFSAQTAIGRMCVDGVSRAMFETLYDLLKNKAATVGIMACLWKVSKWELDTTEEDGIGIMKWQDISGGAGRATAMKKWCTSHGNKKSWKENLTGQITFIESETKTNGDYKSCWKSIMKAKETEAGSEKACKKFYKIFIFPDRSKATDANSSMTAEQLQYAARVNSESGYTQDLPELYEYCETVWSLFIGGEGM